MPDNKTETLKNIDDMQRSALKGELSPITDLLKALYDLRRVEIHAEACDLVITRILTNL